jgi:S1-C subfamily serine protease
LPVELPEGKVEGLEQILDIRKCDYVWFTAPAASKATGGGARLGVMLSPALVITQVMPRSAAQAAGLKEGDVLLKVGDRVVDNLKVLRGVLQQLKPGQKATVTVLRAGKKVSIEVRF